MGPKIETPGPKIVTTGSKIETAGSHVETAGRGNIEISATIAGKRHKVHDLREINKIASLYETIDFLRLEA